MLAPDHGPNVRSPIPYRDEQGGVAAEDLLAPASPLLFAQNKAKPHERCPEH